MSIIAELDLTKGAVGAAWTERMSVAVGLVSEGDIASLPIKEISIAEAFRDAKFHSGGKERLWVKHARDELKSNIGSLSGLERIVAQINFASRLCAVGALGRQVRYLDEAIYHFEGAEQDAQEWRSSSRKERRKTAELLGKSKHGLAFTLCQRFGFVGIADDLDRAAGLLESAVGMFTRFGDTGRAQVARFEHARVCFHLATERKDDAATIQSGLVYRSAIQNHRFETTDLAVTHRVWLAQLLIHAANRRNDANVLRVAADVAGEAAQILSVSGEKIRIGGALGLQGIALVGAVCLDGSGFQEAHAVLERSSQMLVFGPSVVVAHVHFTLGLLQLNPGSGVGDRTEELDQSSDRFSKAYTIFQQCSSKEMAAKSRVNQGIALLERAQKTRGRDQKKRHEEAYMVCASAVHDAGGDSHLSALALCYQGAAAYGLASLSQSTGAWSDAVALLHTSENQLRKHAQVHLLARVCYAQALLGQAKQLNDQEGLLRATEKLNNVAEDVVRLIPPGATSASEVDTESRSVALSKNDARSTEVGRGTEEISEGSGTETEASGVRETFASAVGVLKSRMVRPATDQDIAELEVLLADAKDNGIPAGERVASVVDIRLILGATCLELVDADDGTKLTLTIKNNGAYLVGGGRTRPLSEVSVTVKRQPPLSFSKRPSQAKSGNDVNPYA